MKFGKGTEDVLSDLSFYQNNLLKNYLNPAVCNKDKNKILQKYTDLQNLEKSLCRYNSLRENNVYAKSHKVTIEEAIADSERDQVANRLGRERGRKYPYCDCSILMHDLLPDYKK